MIILVERMDSAKSYDVARKRLYHQGKERLIAVPFWTHKSNYWHLVGKIFRKLQKTGALVFTNHLKRYQSFTVQSDLQCMMITKNMTLAVLSVLYNEPWWKFLTDRLHALKLYI